MLTIIPPEIADKIIYVDGKLTATEKLADKEQILFDDVVRKEQEDEESRFVEE